MIRRPPRSTLSSSSAASDVYKRQVSTQSTGPMTNHGQPAVWMLLLLVARSTPALSSPTFMAASSEPSGRPHPSSRRIIGGSPAPAGKYPWFAEMSKVEGNPHMCGMTMISPYWAITACHCIIRGDYKGYRGAAGSELTTGCTKMGDPRCTTHAIKRWVPHPCYFVSCCDDHDDLCMAELEQPADLPSYARVAGLDGPVDTPAGSPVMLIGMGMTNTPTITNTLMEVQVNTVSQSACMQQEPGAVDKNLINFDNVICTGGEEGRDSCNGDSGSPLVGSSGNSSVILGVLVKGTELPSKGPSCGAAGRMAVYTRLDKYTDFLRVTMAGETYTCTHCHKQGGDSCTNCPNSCPRNANCSTGDIDANHQCWGVKVGGGAWSPGWISATLVGAVAVLVVMAGLAWRGDWKGVTERLRGCSEWCKARVGQCFQAARPTAGSTQESKAVPARVVIPSVAPECAYEKVTTDELA
eukprot:TRINITY_DN16529_c0_g1_i4.p1 TRINITY_DN16529_c0_g1~~TRINITY_DN16529_c0_g1_i4.p1  ORF type:complete len:467 (+),score=69.13 TRINITY_DN16529_c0_g1_i4:118-1518(+)